MTNPSVLAVRGSLASSPLAQQWHAAIEPVILRHPQAASTVLLQLDATMPPVLHFALDRAFDTGDPTKVLRSPFAIASVRLCYFPGVALARAWLAAAFVGYLQHEAFELVTIGDLKTPVLNPHADGYPDCPANRGLKHGMPSLLTQETLRATLAVVLGEAEAARLTS